MRRYASCAASGIPACSVWFAARCPSNWLCDAKRKPRHAGGVVVNSATLSSACAAPSCESCNTDAEQCQRGGFGHPRCVTTSLRRYARAAPKLRLCRLRNMAIPLCPPGSSQRVVPSRPQACTERHWIWHTRTSARRDGVAAVCRAQQRRPIRGAFAFRL